MSLNVSITKQNNEAPSSVLRRFTKKTQEWGGLAKAREKRYATRKLSYYKSKKATLKKIKKNDERLTDIKLGKNIKTGKTK